MERRETLRLLGGGLAMLSGCGGVGTVGESNSATVPEEETLGDRRFSRIESVEHDSLTLQIVPEDVPKDWRSGFHVAVFSQTYPRGEVVRTGHSDLLEGVEDSETTVTIPLEEPTSSRPEYVHRVVELRAAAPNSDPEPGSGPTIAETDRYRLESGTLHHDPHPETVGSADQGSFSREAVEGAYEIRIRGTESEWELPLRVFKSLHVMGRTGWRGHDYPPYVDQATANGLAGYLSTELTRAATALDRDPIRFAIEVVQALPYVPESVTEAADEYIKYPAETLVDGGGDCEDSAILLASLLQEPPIDRECALIHPPHHMGLGLTGDYGGTYYRYEGNRYFYVETTGSGWEIGELPEEYADTSALVFQV